MLKKIIIFTFTAIMIFSLSACGGCEHEWVEATCTQAKFCSLCETAEGEPLGHSWEEATYEAPKTCSGCGLTEGEPLENPAYETDNVRASAAYASVQSDVSYLLGADRALSYHEDEHVLYFKLTLNNGAAEAYAGRGDNWGLLTAYIKMMSQNGTLAFKEEGLDIPLHVIVFDDRDGSSVLYEVENGTVITDVYSDIVPEFLKTSAFESAFRTVYHNCGNSFDITVQYDPAAQIIYFMLAPDADTSTFLKITPAEIMKTNNYWTSTIERMNRWSTEFSADFVNGGQNVVCAFFLVDGTNPDLAFYAVANGVVFFNYHA